MRPLPSASRHYDLKQEIGRGALSVVYEAQDTRTGQEVALKLLTLPSSLTPEEAGSMAARFEREARTAARLSHPNIVNIHEIGMEQGRHYLALEYLHGQTLRRRMSAGPLTSPEAFSLLIQIAGALDAVHQAEAIHRDVKPTNVILLPDGKAKLLDFGIAPSAEEAGTQRAILVGSPSYMAPEQITGEGGSAAADIWALGVLAYELLAGRLPFTGPSAGGVMHQIVHQPPAAMPHLPLSVQRVLLRVLDKHPSERYATASAFVQALRLAYPAQAPPTVKPKPAPCTSVGSCNPARCAAAAPLKPAVTEPKPVLASSLAAAKPQPAPAPKPQPAPAPKPAMPSEAAAPASRPAPRWLPAATLSFLFLAGFGGAALMRLDSVGHAPKEAARQNAAPRFGLSLAQPSMTPRTNSDFSSGAAPEPTAVSTLPAASVPSTSPKVQMAPRRQAVRQVAPALPEPRQDAAVTNAAVSAAPEAASIKPAPAIWAVAPAAAPRRLVASVKQTVSLRQLPPTPAPRIVRIAPVQTAAPPVSVKPVSPRLALSSAVPQGVAQISSQSSGPPVSAQAPAQTFTLPSEGSGYDPEAAARLRKLAWSQTGSAATNGEPQK